jgi:hypothetical protein
MRAIGNNYIVYTFIESEGIFIVLSSNWVYDKRTKIVKINSHLAGRKVMHWAEIEHLVKRYITRLKGNGFDYRSQTALNLIDYVSPSDKKYLLIFILLL